MYLNEANLLNNLRLRYKKDNIYVRIPLFFCLFFISLKMSHSFRHMLPIF